MKFLLLEIWGYLLFAFLLGMFVQYWFCCRRKKGEVSVEATPLVGVATPLTQEVTDTEPAQDANSASVSARQPNDQDRPIGFDSAPTDPDELKRIKGIGAVIETTLNDLGVYKFEQIAQWNADNISWVENSIAFPGRIGREQWTSQAKTLAEGGTTEFAKRVDTGEIDYK